MEKSREILEEADLKILVVDGATQSPAMQLATQSPATSHLPAAPMSPAEQPQPTPDLVVLTKQDLWGAKSATEAPEVAKSATVAPEGPKFISVSAKTGFGVDALAATLNSRLFKENENPEDLWITSEREKACLEDALAGIDRALDLIRKNPAVELLAFEMQLVRRALQSIVGEISSEDVLQSIFAGFCIGK